jgi:hypothetical protein
MMSDKRTLPEVLKELMATKNVSADKLASATNVPYRFISALVEGNYRELPSKPYVRGYLAKIAAAIGADADDLLQSYSDSLELSSSGETDRLPTNRFALRPISVKLIAAAALIIVAGGVVALHFNDIVGLPEPEVNVPAATRSEILKVTGRVKAGDRLVLNGEVVYPRDDGYFEKDIFLTPGLNTLEFSVKRFLGRETKLTKQVFYETTP